MKKNSQNPRSTEIKSGIPKNLKYPTHTTIRFSQAQRELIADLMFPYYKSITAYLLSLVLEDFKRKSAILPPKSE